MFGFNAAYLDLMTRRPFRELL